MSFPPAALTLTMGTGTTVTVTVTDQTKISWDHESAACPDPAATADRTPGRLVHELDTQDSEDAEDGQAITVQPVAHEPVHGHGAGLVLRLVGSRRTGDRRPARRRPATDAVGAEPQEPSYHRCIPQGVY